MPQHKLKNLLSGTPESYYWLGFLLADGHFSKNGRMQVALSSKDKNHLEKFLNFLDCKSVIKDTSNNSHHPVADLRIMDKQTIEFLKEKYSISSNKTYFPPSIESLSELEKFCVMIGFIDGDGCIQYQYGRNDCKMTVKCHSSWLNVLIQLFGSAYLNNRGYSNHCTSNNETLRDWKNRAISLNLPIMFRKWDKIDTSKVSKYTIARSWQSKAIELFQMGNSVKEIASQLNKKYITVYMALVRKNIIRKEV